MKLPFVRKTSNRWGITDRMFFSLFLTGALIEFSQVGAGFIDGLIVSRYLGQDAMAAFGIAYPIYSILGVVSGLLAVGMEIKCSQAIGRGNLKDFNRFFSVTVYVGSAVSVLMTVLILCFAKPFTVLLGASGSAASLQRPAADYLIGVGVGIPALIMSAILSPALQLDSGEKIIQRGALIITVADVLIDIAAVRFGWGILGIGLATAVSNYLNLFYMCTHFRKKDRMLRFVKPDVKPKEFFTMLADGSEKAIKRLANIIRPVALNIIIISYGGTAAVSALSVRNNFSGFVEIAGAGIAAATSLLTGLYYGEVNEEAIKEVNGYGRKLTLLFSGSICLLLLIFAELVARLYVSEGGEMMNMVVFAIQMLALQCPLQTLIASRIKYLQAIRRKYNMNLLIFAAQLIFVLLSSFMLGKLFGVYGILASYTVSDFLSLAAVLIFYMVKNRKVRITEKEILNLPAEFQLAPGDVISLDIRDMEDVSLVSEQIMLFCRGHQFDRKTAYYSALAVEELANNIVEYGFPQCKSSQPLIDLRVVISEGALVIRMRDNCPRFDVTEQFVQANAEDADRTSNIGVRIVSKVAEDIQYLHVFDTNSIIMRFSPGGETAGAVQA